LTGVQLRVTVRLSTTTADVNCGVASGRAAVAGVDVATQGGGKDQ
jgi:hypothetical protein